MPTARHSSRTGAPLRAALPPAYQLYGEPGPALTDRLHGESIADRSRLHGWEIRPHRHAQLFQCLVVEAGAVQARLEGRSLHLPGPCAITVPALAVHGFRFAPDTQGHVFTVHEPHLLTMLQAHAALRTAVLRLQAQAWPRRGVAAAPGRAVQAAARALRDGLVDPGPWRAAALDAALLQLLVALARALPEPPAHALSSAAPAPPAPPRALVHVQGLQDLVELHFRRQPSQAELAAALGITPTQLNRACQRVLGHSAQGVLHARLLLQAQRELAYSGLSIKQIAFELGFTDAAYFTRFFRRGAGGSPQQWRAAQSGEPRRTARTAA